jgi:hypothetical protein
MHRFAAKCLCAAWALRQGLAVAAHHEFSYLGMLLLDLYILLMIVLPSHTELRSRATSFSPEFWAFPII